MTDTDAQLIERLDTHAERRSERREFFRTALGAGAIAAAGAAVVVAGSQAMAQATSDTDVLNYALNLEYLEAQFYSYAVFGTGLAASQLTPGSANTTTQGALSATGAHAVAFTDPLVAQYAREIAVEKAAHVAFLRTTLATVAVAQPAIDISVSATSAFSTLFRAAGLAATGASFDPYASDTNFLLAAFLFEDVAVTAYRGAASVLSTKAYIEAAAGLLAATAYHASIIRTVLYTKGVTTPTLRTSADAISNARDALDGTSDDDQGISSVTLTNVASPTPAPGSYAPFAPAGLIGQVASNIVPTGPDGLTYGRSITNGLNTALNILYLNSLSVSKGGFFPNGLNGTYNTSGAN